MGELLRPESEALTIQLLQTAPLFISNSPPFTHPRPRDDKLGNSPASLTSSLTVRSLNSAPHSPIFGILYTHSSPVEGGDLHSVPEQKAQLTTCQAWESCSLNRLFPRAVQGELVLCRVWRSFKVEGWETSSGWNLKALVDL